MRTSFAMNSFIPLLLFCNLIIGSYSAVYLERQTEIPGREGQCYDKEENVFYKIGEEMKWRSKECGRKICGSSNGKLFIEIQTCGKIGVPPGCYKNANLSLPYPNCCDRIVCKKIPDLKSLLSRL